MAFLSGNATDMTYQEAQRKRALAEALLGQSIQSAPRNIGEGWTAIGQALAGRIAGKKADKAERAGQAEADGLWGKIWGGALGGSQPGGMSASGAVAPAGGFATPRSPDPLDPRNIAGDAMAALGKGGNNFSGVLEAGKGYTVVMGPDGKPQRREGVRSWRNNNPGNIEFGDFARSMGAIGTDGRFAVFPDYETGRKAKEKLLFESSGYKDKTIAGAISRYAPSFENDTGSYIGSVASAIGVDPNTPLAALTPEQRVAMLDAMQQVEGFKVGTIDGLAAPNPMQATPAPQGGQITMSAAGGPLGMSPYAPGGDGGEALGRSSYAAGVDPMQAQQPMPMQADPMAGIDPATLMAALSNPYMSQEQKSVIGTLLQQKLAPPDPMADIELQKAQLELQQMQNPGQPKPTDDISEYEYAKMQGYQGSFTDFQAEMKKAGASNTTVTVGGAESTDPAEGALRKTLGETQGKQWAEYANAGVVSAGTAQDMALLDQLIPMVPSGPIQGRLAEAFPGFSSAGDAFQSIVKRVAPTLRAPGSGATSDIEYDGMLKSLPALRNSPEANQAIGGMMKAKAALNIERAGIIADFQNGRMSITDARDAMAELDKRSIMTPDLQALFAGLGGGGATPAPAQSGPVVTDDGYTIEAVE